MLIYHQYRPAIRLKTSMMTSSNGDIFRVTGLFVRGIHRSPVNSLHKGQRRGALMFSLICVWTNNCVNNRDAGDLRRHRAHYDVTVMSTRNGHGTSPYHTNKQRLQRIAFGMSIWEKVKWQINPLSPSNTYIHMCTYKMIMIIIVYWFIRNKNQCNFNHNSNIFIEENAFCKMASILFVYFSSWHRLHTFHMLAL